MWPVHPVAQMALLETDADRMGSKCSPCAGTLGHSYLPVATCKVKGGDVYIWLCLVDH